MQYPGFREVALLGRERVPNQTDPSFVARVRDLPGCLSHHVTVPLTLVGYRLRMPCAGHDQSVYGVVAQLLRCKWGGTTKRCWGAAISRTNACASVATFDDDRISLTGGVNPT